jgi:putative spermidine/putrescine transport system substrate-binding protein
MKIRRRALVGAAAATALARPARAAQRLTMFLFPGATTEAWRELYIRPFTEKTGIEVRIANPPGDPSIWLRTRAREFNVTIGNPTVLSQYAQGEVEGLDPAEFPALADIPAGFQSIAPDGRLVGMPVYFQFYGIAINTDHATTADFTSWHDLADPKWKGRIGLGNYAEMYELPWFNHVLGRDLGEAGAGLDLYKAILANCLTIPRNMVQANQLLRSGEIVAMPYYSAQIWTQRSQGAANLAIAVPKEGAMILPYLLAIPKGAEALAEAKQFLAFCAAPPTAAEVAERIGLFPVSRGMAFPARTGEVLGLDGAALMQRLVALDWTAINANMARLADAVRQANAARP